MFDKSEKRLAAMEKLLADIEAHERSTNGRSAPIRWGGEAPGAMDLFLSMPKRISQTEDNHLGQRYLVVMRLALAFFLEQLKRDPGLRSTLDEGKILELVGVANRFAPKFKMISEWYRTHGFTDGKPDRAKLKEIGCPIQV